MVNTWFVDAVESVCEKQKQQLGLANTGRNTAGRIKRPLLETCVQMHMFLIWCIFKYIALFTLSPNFIQ